MIIVNPIYDHAFKLLMENTPIAIKIIATIINQKILNLDIRPQETISIDVKREFPLFRYDFKAIIETEEGKQKTVLIEVQKSKTTDPIIRFRKYLASAYMSLEKVGEQEKALPIITIYFLGYNLPEYTTPAIIVDNRVIDATTKKTLSVKNDFVELLTHPSYILQVERLPEKRKTRLERMLLLFNQARKTQNRYLLNLSGNELSELEEDEELREITAYLNRIAQDQQTLSRLELEEEVDSAFTKQEQELEKTKEALLKSEKEKQEAQKEKQKAQKEKQEMKVKLLKSAKMMKETGMKIQQISEMLGLSIQEIENL